MPSLLAELRIGAHFLSHGACNGQRRLPEGGSWTSVGDLDLVTHRDWLVVQSAPPSADLQRLCIL